MTLPLFMSKARKWLGLLAFWCVLFVCVFGYPAELNLLLGISDVLSAGDQLNGPNDMTMLIRMVLGLLLGVAADIFVLKAVGKLFPMSRALAGG
ncbi:hypothetical protein [Pseudomonas psychrophila]|uniref:Uncharacterized protein n=1 Tax=Pseudomonas psychrophila TaxID=122355 RepID=A0A8I1K7D7_9PSED|nr:hypothetical protein [Pseudomonas psychrophila]AVX93293.1 hypothetical protein PkP19E3_34775 [Pseudomonas koreensis]MBJ2259724.1 hypothetical protein [Pseudomonas psychrophila]